LIDGILVAAEFCQHCTQVGAGFNTIRFGGDAGLVFANGARQIPGLMQLNGAVKDTLRILRLSRQGGDKQGEPQTIQQRILALQD
jgi:hypothetical protein